MKAFPQIFESGVLPKEETGMDLRDYFASKAMQGMLASPNCPTEIEANSFSKNAYAMADAMMKARETK